MTTSSNASPRLYDIRIGGHLDARWAASFDGASISTDPDGTTVLRGVFADQAALHGLLSRLRDTGLPLLGITQVGDGGGLMRAAVYRRFGGPEVVSIRDVDRPRPGAGQLLIRVHASTVSAADHRTRARDVPAGLLLPSSFVLGFFRPRRPILGMDAAGVVVAVGAGVGTFAPGDEVIAMLGSRFGGHAEYAIVDAGDAVAAKPSQLSFGEAVSLVFGGITAQAYLRQAQIGAATRVLVNGASGAVGTAMVQLAKAAGAHVTAVASAANHAFVLCLGADRVIDYATEDFAAEGSRYDVIADCVGNAPVARIADSLAPGGTVLVVAGDLRAIAGARRDERRHGITVITGPGAYRSDDLEHVARLADGGELRPVIDRTFALDQIVEAHRLVDSGHKRGSVVVTLDH